MVPNRHPVDPSSRFNLAHLAPASTASEVNFSTGAAACYELRFRPLLDEGPGYAFPCDAAGRVDLDALGNRARNDYFCARVLVGRDYAVPTVQLSAGH